MNLKFWQWGNKGKPTPAAVPASQPQHPQRKPAAAPHPVSRPRTLTASQRLSGWTHEVDKIINHILGYLLAITGLIAFIDVVGDGKALSMVPWLFWFWVIVQGLGVDFQILALLRRLPVLFNTKRAVFWANIAFLVLLVCMLIIIGAVFVQAVETPTDGIAGAMNHLGIPQWGFVWLRSVLSALLLVIFGIDRALEVYEHQRIEDEANSGANANGTNGAPEQSEQPLPPNVVTHEQLSELFAQLLCSLRQTVIAEVTTTQEQEQERTLPPSAQQSEPLRIAPISLPQSEQGSQTANSNGGQAHTAFMAMLAQTQQQSEHPAPAAHSSSSQGPRAVHLVATASAAAENKPRFTGLRTATTEPLMPAVHTAASEDVLLDETKLTDNQQRILAALRARPASSVSELSEETKLSRGYISDQRKRLQLLLAREEPSADAVAASGDATKPA